MPLNDLEHVLNRTKHDRKIQTSETYQRRRANEMNVIPSPKNIYMLESITKNCSLKWTTGSNCSLKRITTSNCSLKTTLGAIAVHQAQRVSNILRQQNARSWNLEVLNRNGFISTYIGGNCKQLYSPWRFKVEQFVSQLELLSPDIFTATSTVGALLTWFFKAVFICCTSSTIVIEDGLTDI